MKSSDSHIALRTLCTLCVLVLAACDGPRSQDARDASAGAPDAPRPTPPLDQSKWMCNVEAVIDGELVRYEFGPDSENQPNTRPHVITARPGHDSKAYFRVELDHDIGDASLPFFFPDDVDAGDALYSKATVELALEDGRIWKTEIRPGDEDMKLIVEEISNTEFAGIFSGKLRGTDGRDDAEVLEGRFELRPIR